MLYLHKTDGSQEEDENTKLLPNSRASISFLECTVLLLNCYIGYSTVSISKHNRGGFLMVLAVHLFVYVTTYYTVWMFLVVMKNTHVFTIREMWQASNYKLSFVVSIGFFVSGLAFVSWNVEHLTVLSKVLRTSYFPSAPSFLFDPYFFMLIFMSTVLAPMYFRRDNGFLVVTSYIGDLCALLILAFSIRWFVNSIQTSGFDPKHEFKWFDKSYSFLSCYTEYLGAYVNYVFIFLGVANLKDLTYRSAKRLMLVSMTIFFFYLELLTTFQYFVVYDSFTTGSILSLLPNSDPTVIATLVCLCVKQISVMPNFLNPAREAILTTFVPLRNYPLTMWATTGIVMMVVAIFFACQENIVYDVLNVLINCILMLMQFMVPGVLMIKNMKGQPWIHWIGLSLMSITGVAFCITQLYSLF